MTRVVVLTSGKGGVGKTTCTANLGMALAQKGQRIVVIDADFGLRNLDLLLGLENRIVFTALDVLAGDCRLEQALVNLIVNAAEADAGPLRIAVRCTTFERPLAGPSVPSGPLPLARGLRIDVQDDGPGIPENLHSRVFDPFYTTKADGTGLGLPMAREAMLACGGDLRVRPNRHGACFSIWVPRA